MPADFINQLHFGDNLVRLRGEGVDKPIPDEVADLIYLDPPFNSARNYNLLFKQHKGQESPAQIMTFEDTWTDSPFLMTQFKGDSRNAKRGESALLPEAWLIKDRRGVGRAVQDGQHGLDL